MSTRRALNPVLLLLCAAVCSVAWSQTASTPTQSTTDSLAQPAPAPQTPGNAAKTPSDQPSSVSPGDSTKLEPLKIEKAVYPMEAREKQLQGQVWVRMSVTEAGDVKGVELVSGDPILAKAALEAAKKWKFKPFIKNGKPVPVSAKVPFDFAFSDELSKFKVIEPQGSQTPGTEQNPASGDVSQPVKIPSGLSAGLLIHRVNPVYPVEARQARIQGVVILQAEISTEGRITNLRLISGPPELAKAAIGAVQQWRYKPYMLMGKPVAVQTQVQVNFTLSFN